MENKNRFRYHLQPLLLTRQWALDALKQELAIANERCTECKEVLEQLKHGLDEANAAWSAQMAVGAALSNFSISMRYLLDLANQCNDRKQQLDVAEQERDALVEQAGVARRALDAVERHRDEMRAAFFKEGANIACKESDDQWLVLQNRKELYECDF